MIQNTKRCSEKPPTLTASYLDPSSFFCTHQEITYAYTSKYPPSPHHTNGGILHTLYCTFDFFHLIIYLKKLFYINT